MSEPLVDSDSSGEQMRPWRQRHSQMTLTVTEGLGLDERAAFLHRSFGFLQPVLGPLLGRLHQLLHLGRGKVGP